MGIRLKIFKDTDETPQTVTQLPLQPHLRPLLGWIHPQSLLSAPQHTQTSF